MPNPSNEIRQPLDQIIVRHGTEPTFCDMASDGWRLLLPIYPDLIADGYRSAVTFGSEDQELVYGCDQSQAVMENPYLELLQPRAWRDDERPTFQNFTEGSLPERLDMAWPFVETDDELTTTTVYYRPVLGRLAADSPLRFEPATRAHRPIRAGRDSET